jgi:hypothetical protein
VTYDDHLYCASCGHHHTDCWCHPDRHRQGWEPPICYRPDPHDGPDRHLPTPCVLTPPENPS